MGMTFKCKACGNKYRLGSWEIEECDIGTRWAPVLETTCPACGSVNHCEITVPEGNLEGGVLLDAWGEIIDGEDPFVPVQYELFLQKLVIAHAKELFGVKAHQKPRARGPDIVLIDGNLVEVEKTWKNYIYHHHHEDKAFKHVKYLVVFDEERPEGKNASKLPPKIIHITQEQLERWSTEYHEAGEDEGEDERERLQQMMQKTWLHNKEAIKGEFMKMYARNCDAKHRDMATCPCCEMCAYSKINYFGSGVDLVDKMAREFMKWVGLERDGTMKLSHVTNAHLQEFYIHYLSK